MEIHLLHQVTSLESKGIVRTRTRVSDIEIDAAERVLELDIPLSVRKILTSVGALELPPALAVVHSILGVNSGPFGNLISRTQELARRERVTKQMMVVGLGASGREWFCIRCDGNEHPPVYLYDAVDDALEGIFYPTYSDMVKEVVGFVTELADVTAVAPSAALLM